jgi:Uma2 family endonuclease
MTITHPGSPPLSEAPPALENGDRMTRAEFERRYDAMPNLKKAELIEGVVYVPSPVTYRKHARPHLQIITWLGNFDAATAGVEGGDNASLRLDLDNEPQPDGFLMILPSHGGQARIDEDDYVAGGPELVAEVASSSASYDLHTKFNVYRRNEVREYIAWRTRDRAIDWFVQREGEYERLAPGADGYYRSEVLPGLWLDAEALIGGDMTTVLRVLEQGLASPEHAEFVARLERAAGAAERSSPLTP